MKLNSDCLTHVFYFLDDFYYSFVFRNIIDFQHLLNKAIKNDEKKVIFLLTNHNLYINDHIDPMIYNNHIKYIRTFKM